jgi:hypothetical protein
MDVVDRAYPQAIIQPDEPNLYAGWDFANNDLAVWKKHPNKARLGGALYDLIPSAVFGVSRVGQGGGIYSVDNPASSWTCAPVIPVPSTTSAYAMELDVESNPTALRYLLVNGSVSGYETRISNTGVISISFDRATMSSSAAGFGIGRGQMRVAGIFDGVNQHLVISGRLIDSDAVAPAAPVGYFAVGEHTTIRKVQVYNAIKSLAQERAAYVSQFAKNVVWSWTPVSCGEGPASGVLTGSTPGGYATCPSGGATMQFVWRSDLSIPNGGRLCLTDSNPAGQRRIALAHTKMPVFGSWILRYQVRDPATDSFQFALTQLPDVDYTAAGSQSYHVNLRQVAGPWWRASLYYENGAQIDAVDTPSLPIVGDRGALLLTHAVDGTWQIESYLDSLKSWFWSAAAPVHVTQLSSNYLVIAPRGAYVESAHRCQSEMTSAELAVRV